MSNVDQVLRPSSRLEQLSSFRAFHWSSSIAIGSTYSALRPWVSWQADQMRICSCAASHLHKIPRSPLLYYRAGLAFLLRLFFSSTWPDANLATIRVASLSLPLTQHDPPSRPNMLRHCLVSAASSRATGRLDILRSLARMDLFMAWSYLTTT